MSEYKGIKGFQVQTRTEDPVPYAQALADNPYAGAWASAANMNQARDNLASMGTTTAALGSGGFEPPLSAKSEEWDGSSWTEGNDLNTARSHFHGAGVQTSAIVVGGEAPSLTNAAEEYDGTSYTTVTAYPGSKASIGALGATNTAALFMGGYPVTTESFEYDGTNYTEGGDLNTGREDMAAAGTQTAGIAIGGSPRTAVVEQYNGSAWTEVSDLNTARNGLAASHQSSYTSVLAFGGNTPGTTAATESWDGSSWTEVADLATARYDLGGSGNSNQSALAFAGGTPSRTTATELWTFSGLDPSSTPAADYADAIVGDFYYNSTTGQFKNNVAGVGSWATGGDLNNGRGQIGSASISGNTTGFGFGGWDTPASAARSYAEQYNGTAWTEGPDMPGTARLAGAFGVNTSCVSAGGSTGPGGQPINPGAFEWNGSSWSNGGSMNNARRNSTGAGVSESAGRVIGGGDNPGPAQAYNESYNGTAFTEETDLNTARIGLMGFGTTTDAVVAGGDTLVVEQWDGSSWTEISEILQKTDNSGGRCGSSSSDGMIFTRDQSSSMITQKWDGTSWTELADLSVSRYNNSGGGPSSSNALSFGGYGPPAAQMVSTEEWEVPDFETKTVTTS